MDALKGKTVLVTGASSGIGRAGAMAFARRGANVVLAARHEDRLREVAAEVEKAGAKSLVVPTDVTRADQVQRLVDASIEHFGRIDVVLNNAGRGLIGAFADTPVEKARELFEVDFFAAATVMQAALRAMERQGAGVIINIASTAGVLPFPYMSFYHAAKAALVSLSESVSIECMGTGLKVIAFCPHVTETEFSSAVESHGRFRRSPVLGMPVERGRSVERAIRALSLTFGNPFGPMSAENVADRLVRAALRPKPLIVLGGFTHRGLLAKCLLPQWFYSVAKKYRDLMNLGNPPDRT